MPTYIEVTANPMNPRIIRPLDPHCANCEHSEDRDFGPYLYCIKDRVLRSRGVRCLNYSRAPGADDE